MNHCIDERILNRFLEDTLEPNELLRLHEHANLCESCQKEFESWKALKQSLAEVSEIELPPQLKAKVMARVAIEKVQTHVMNVRKGFALVFSVFVLIYYILHPFIRPLTKALASEILKFGSSVLYAMLDFLGIEPTVLFRLFGGLMTHMESLFWVFAVTSVLMVIAFFALILKGKTAAKTN